MPYLVPVGVVIMLTGQIREGIQSILERGEEAALSTADTIEAGLDNAEASFEEVAEVAAEVAEDASDAMEEASGTVEA